MSAKIPPARRFPKRLSQEELKEKTSKYMNMNGADNHFKALYYRKTADEVVGLDDNKFYTLQPDIHHKDYKDVAWNRTFDFVIKWLQQYDMQITLEAMEKEFGSDGMPPEDDSLDNIDEYFNELQKARNTIRAKKFTQKVSEWKQEEKKQGL